MSNLALFLLAGCATRAQLHALEARVAALEAPPVAPVAPVAEAPPSADEAAAAALAAARARIDALDFSGAKALLSEIPRSWPGTQAATSATRLASEIAIVGQPAPPLDVASWVQGQAALPAQGAVMLVFFESWCPHCRNEGPHLQEIEATWGPRGLHVVGLTRLTRSATVESVAAMAAEHAWTFPVGVEREGAVTAAYGGGGVPSAAVVRDGLVVWRGHPAKLGDTQIEALLR